MTKMISTQAHRYAGVALSKFETFEVVDDRYVQTLIDLGRAEVIEEAPDPQPTPQQTLAEICSEEAVIEEPSPKPTRKPRKKTRRKH